MCENHNEQITDFLASLGISGNSDLEEMARKASTKPAERVTVADVNAPVNGDVTVVVNPYRVKSKSKPVSKTKNFDEKHPGLREFLADATWSGFAQSLSASLMRYGSLTDKQLSAALSMKAKCDARQAERSQPRETTTVDISRIEEMFAAAGAHLKRPKIKCGRLTVSPAPVTGRNAGSLYVKVDGEYAGKITDGHLYTVRSAPAETKSLVTEFAADPKGKLVEHGRLTGSCGCCGRELTNHESIALGIGPICAGRFGL